jgi:hypothetical protein
MTGEMPEDERIAGLFRAAASDTGAPPPRFDHGDVVATSRRITARRRSAVIGGALALLVVAGVGTVATLPRGHTDTVSAAAPAAPAQDAAGSAGRAGQAAAPEAAAPEAAAPEAAVGGPPGGPGACGSGMGCGDGSGPGVAGGGAGSGGAAQPPAPAGVPLGPGTTACADRQDPALRALVVQALPEAAGARAAATTDVCLPGSERYVSLELGGGVLTVADLPPGTAPSLADGAVTAPTASHGTVVVATPPGYRDRAPALVQYLAPRL